MVSVPYSSVRFKVSVIEHSFAIKRSNGKQTGGRQLELRTSLRPLLEIYLGWLGFHIYSSFLVRDML